MHTSKNIGDMSEKIILCNVYYINSVNNMWFDTEFDKMFQRLSGRFFTPDDVIETPGNGQVQTFGPYYYGYQMTVGPDGKPQVREWGNVRPDTSNAIAESGTRQPAVDEIFDEKARTLKLVAEMPGIEKSDIKVSVADGTIDLSAEHDDRKYHCNVPLKYQIDENSAKASYANGILQVQFKVPEEKPKGKTIPVV